MPHCSRPLSSTGIQGGLAEASSASRFLCKGSGLCRVHSFFTPSKRKEQGGEAEPTWFTMGINLEYEVSDQIKIKDTFII